jgi:lipoprotein Spr
MASCKSKKSVATSSSTKSKTNVVENSPAKALNDETKNISNKTLVNFIENWYGTIYKYGGSDKHGIDCSHFASRLYADVYKKTITGPASAMEQEALSIKMPDMREGDLLFFKIESDKVSHVGIYIGDNKFVHASTRKGVIISDLNEPYYKKYFYKAGKLK